MRDCIRNERKTLAFAASAGGSGDGEERQHRLGSLADTPVVLHLTAVGEQEIAPLGRIHGTTTAEADNEINALAAG